MEKISQIPEIPKLIKEENSKLETIFSKISLWLSEFETYLLYKVILFFFSK